jgi:beta-galactosidase
VEVVRRDGDGRSFLFLLNHGSDETRIALDGPYRNVLTEEECGGEFVLESFGVAVLRAS